MNICRSLIAAALVSSVALSYASSALPIKASAITASPVSVPLSPQLSAPTNFKAFNAYMQHYGSVMQACPNAPGYAPNQYVDACLQLASSTASVVSSAAEMQASNRQAMINLAWHNFLALNSVSSVVRGTPQATFQLAQSGGKPGVWETYHHRIELYGGAGIKPNGPVPRQKNAPPLYYYGYYSGRAESSLYSQCPRETNKSTPWHNLDENSQIGFVYISAQPEVGTLEPILFEAKINNTHYDYVTANQYWKKNSNGYLLTPQYLNIALIHGYAPVGRGTPTLFFPAGSIETKAAWRRLTPAEVASKQFYMASVRYYTSKNGLYNPPCFVNSQLANTSKPTDVWGLVGLHIIMRPYFIDVNGDAQPYPYFVFTTFEQKSNYNLPKAATKAVSLLAPSQAAVSDPGISYEAPIYSQSAKNQLTTPKLTANDPCTIRPNPKAPLVMSYLSNGPVQKKIGYASKCSIAGKNLVSPASPDPMVNVLARRHLQSNGQQGITTPPQFAEAIQGTVWQNYQLTEVQFQPTNPAAGYGQQNPYPKVTQQVSSYYMANGVIETPYSLSKFRGVALSSSEYAKTLFYNRISDILADSHNKPAYNVLTFGGGFQFGTQQTASPGFDQSQHAGQFNMGGCMGCHGTNQTRGGDFSFLLADSPFSSATTIDSATLVPPPVPESKFALSPKERVELNQLLAVKRRNLEKQRQNERSIQYNLTIAPFNPDRLRLSKPQSISSRFEQSIRMLWAHLMSAIGSKA